MHTDCTWAHICATFRGKTGESWKKTHMTGNHRATTMVRRNGNSCPPLITFHFPNNKNQREKESKRKEKIKNRQATKSQRYKVFATESKESETSVLRNNSSLSGRPVRREFGSIWDNFLKWVRAFPENKETRECSLGKHDRRLEGTVWEMNSLL